MQSGHLRCAEYHIDSAWSCNEKVVTPLSDFFEKMVTVGHRIKEIASERKVDKTTQQTAATEAAARQRWMFIAGTFLRSLRLSDLACFRPSPLAWIEYFGISQVSSGLDI